MSEPEARGPEDISAYPARPNTRCAAAAARLKKLASPESLGKDPDKPGPATFCGFFPSDSGASRVAREISQEAVNPLCPLGNSLSLPSDSGVAPDPFRNPSGRAGSRLGVG